MKINLVIKKNSGTNSCNNTRPRIGDNHEMGSHTWVVQQGDSKTQFPS